MLLTIYFMAATWIQSWRLRTIYAKLSQYMTQNASVVFYKVQNEGNGKCARISIHFETGSMGQHALYFFYLWPVGAVMPPASSELCTNYAQARIADIIWHQEGQRGAALIPKQHLYLSPWISFPEPPSLVPFEMTPSPLDFTLNKGEPVFILLETDLHPNIENANNVLMVIRNSKTSYTNCLWNPYFMDHESFPFK